MPPAVTVERRAATSADGTRVPYFLVSPDGRRPVGAPAHAALGLRRVQDPDPGRLPVRLVRLAGRGRSAGARQPARRRGVRQRVARRRAAGPQAERLRRLRRRRRAPHGVRGHHAEPAGAARPQQRRAAGRRGDDPAAGSGRGGPAGGRRAGHAAVLTGSPSARPGSPTTATRTTPSSSPMLLAYSPLHNVMPGTTLPGHPGADRRPRRPGGAAAQPQVHRRAAARPGGGGAGAHPDRDRHRPRHGQARPRWSRPSGPTCWPSPPTTPACTAPAAAPRRLSARR